MIYREGDEGLRRRRNVLLDARRAEAKTLSPELRAVYVARRARAAAGSAAALGGAWLWVGSAIAPSVDGWRPWPTAILYGSVAGALVIYSLARIQGWCESRWLVERALRPSRDLHGDVVALERWSARDLLRAASDRLERRSVVLLGTAVVLLAPMILHQLLGAALGVLAWGTFDAWIVASVPAVMSCAAFVIVLGIRSLRDLEAPPETPDDVAERWLACTATAGLATLVALIAAGLSPGAELRTYAAAVLVPPTATIAVTLGFAALHRVVRAERQVLAMT